MRTIGQPGVQVVHARRLAQAVQALGCKEATVRGRQAAAVNSPPYLPVQVGATFN